LFGLLGRGGSIACGDKTAQGNMNTQPYPVLDTLTLFRYISWKHIHIHFAVSCVVL